MTKADHCYEDEVFLALGDSLSRVLPSLFSNGLPCLYFRDQHWVKCMGEVKKGEKHPSDAYNQEGKEKTTFLGNLCSPAP